MIPVYLTDFIVNLADYWLTCKHVIFIFFALHPLHHPYSNMQGDLKQAQFGFCKDPR